MTRLALKEYQKETLQVLTEYCREVRRRETLGEARPEHEAFRTMTGREYYTAPGFEGVPYVCLRLPTGGGKTLLAAESIGEIGRALLGTDQPACLWITPSTTIRDQTLRALRRPTHPYRLAPGRIAGLSRGSGDPGGGVDQIGYRAIEGNRPGDRDHDPIVPPARRTGRGGIGGHAANLPRQRLSARGVPGPARRRSVPAWPATRTGW